MTRQTLLSAGLDPRTWLLIAVFGLTPASAENVAAPSPTPNRLMAEISPYLRQHALNPVDWYPWGNEAFQKARAEKKAIFLSIGYSTCHWCHVMAHESFSDPAIARLLNDNFVCIKVDREERPEIDRVYMTFVQASTGSGGWPLSVWLTPDRKPFFGGTYFAPQAFRSTIARVAALWRDQREKVLQQSERMLQALTPESAAAAPAGMLPVAELRANGFNAAARSFDRVHGGFEQAPKFPLPVMLEFLLDMHATMADEAQRAIALTMVTTTLQKIIGGGIHDQIGGGFHRYSVDEKWRVPHFEKMLYDQAQLANVCLSAWQISGDPELKAAAEDALDYVRTQLTDEDGGFFTAEDADSATASDSAVHREGAFYVWRMEELAAALGTEEAAIFNFAFGVRPAGNAVADPSGEFRGQNILFREHTPSETARQFKLTVEEAQRRIADARRQLFAVRAKRPRPLRDDKVVTAWNGLMLTSYARAAQILGRSDYLETAQRTASFLQGKLFDAKTGRLSHTYRGGVRDARGFAEDYAFVIQGLIDLYETTFDVRWLDWAIRLQEKQIELFWDPAAGGFFSSASDDPSVMLRLKQDDEGAEPSPNSIAVRNLIRLAEMLHRDDWHERAVRTAGAFSTQLQRAPTALPQLLASVGWLQGSPKLVLLHGDRDAPQMRALVAETHRNYSPRRVTILVDAQSRAFFDAKVPFVRELPAMNDGPATAYVCENFVCQLPTTDSAVLARLLQPKPPKR